MKGYCLTVIILLNMLTVLFLPLANAQYVHPPPVVPEPEPDEDRKPPPLPLPAKIPSTLPIPPSRVIVTTVLLNITTSSPIVRVKIDDPRLAIREITLVFPEGTRLNGTLRVHLLSSDPYNTVLPQWPLPRVYQILYIEASPEINAKIARAIVVFAVPTGWLDEHNISKLKLTLLRYITRDSLQELPTRQIFGPTPNSITYEAHAPMFSPFIIAGPDPPLLPYPTWFFYAYVLFNALFGAIVGFHEKSLRWLGVKKRTDAVAFSILLTIAGIIGYIITMSLGYA